MKENNKNNAVKGRALKRGVVVGDKMDKTIVVRLDSVRRHSEYRKVVRRSIKIKAHDEKNAAKTGDVVEITQTRALSKGKRWRLTAVVQKSIG